MDDTRKRLALGGVAIAAVASLGTWGLVTLTDDPDEDVDTVQLDAIAQQGGAVDDDDDDRR
jgi:hypothetical protein